MTTDTPRDSLVIPFGGSVRPPLSLNTLLDSKTADELLNPLLPYMNSEVRPPLSFNDLVVISLMRCGGTGGIAKMVYEIITMFPYWRRHVARLPVRHSLPHIADMSLKAGLDEALHDYDTPITGIEHPRCSLMGVRTSSYTLYAPRFNLGLPFSAQTYRVHANDALVYLRKGLSSNMLARDFRRAFEAWPSELRNKVYELLLCFPESGLQIAPVPRWTPTLDRPPNQEKFVWLNTRDMTESLPASQWEPGGLRWGNLGRSRFQRSPFQTSRALKYFSLAITTAIFHLSKKIYDEAKKVFYGQNRFHCNSLAELQDFLATTHCNLLHWIPELTIRYNANPRVASKAFALLARLHNLKHLVLHFDMQHSPGHGPPEVVGIDKLWESLAQLPKLETFDLETIDGGICQLAYYFKYVSETIPGLSHIKFTTNGEPLCLYGSRSFTYEQYLDGGSPMRN